MGRSAFGFTPAYGSKVAPFGAAFDVRAKARACLRGKGKGKSKDNCKDNRRSFDFALCAALRMTILEDGKVWTRVGVVVRPAKMQVLRLRSG